MKKILLPTDFSSNALNAINYALELFNEVYCEFYLLNSFALSDNKLKSQVNKKLYPKQYKKLKEKSENGLNKTLKTLLEKENSYHTFKTYSYESSALEAIQTIVDSENIDLIIMGSKGVTRSRKVAFGTVAIYVMERIRNCPSIIVPESAQCKKPKEIVFPTSYRGKFNRNELNFLVEIARLCNANIAILHVSEKEDLDNEQVKYQEALKDLFKESRYTFHSLSHSSVKDAVRLFAESRESDMISFINKKHLFFDNVLVQPLVKGLSFYSKAPLLVLHDIKIK